MNTLLFLITCIIWSTTWAMIKIGVEETPIMLGLGLRFVIAGLFLYVIIKIKNRKIPFDSQLIKLYLVSGLITMAFSYYCTYYGTKFIPSGLSSILWTTLPLFVGIFSHFILPGGKLSFWKFISIIIAIGGTSIILSDQSLIFSKDLLVGSLIILIGVVASAWPNVYLKIHNDYDSLVLTCMAMLIAGFIHLMGATISNQWDKMVWDFKNLGAIIYLGILGSAIAFYIYYTLLQRINVVKVTFITLIVPIFATMVGWAFLKERVTVKEILGGIIILLGVFLYDWDKYKLILIQNKK
ncbi:MAG: DMT family transporter [Candidatus Marinimicrobia bacterium]|nr:DMT family transporter [Candidatus Neomarinimicrobiota bacterium]